MAAMPAEIQQIVQLYLKGKIREWYSRSDGRGVVLLLGAKKAAEAHAIMGGLPLSKQNMVDDVFIAVSPRSSPSVRDKCEAHLKAANGHNNQGAT
jgi:hypothetical protein